MKTSNSLSALTTRQGQILQITERKGFVTIDGLADEFSVSAQTVRRDIIALSKAGHLQRFHGGAGPVNGEEALRLDHGRKQQVGVEDKRKVAAQAAATIPEGASLYLDVGTTLEMTAQALKNHAGLTVFTNSMRAALSFERADVTVHVLGGRRAGQDGSLVGENIVTTLLDLRIDYALLSCSAVEESGRVMDFDLGKIAVKKAAMRAADTSCLLLTPSKFHRSALAAIARIDAFDHVFDGQ
ncbi:MAG: DeoR/GlpR family DNA-binding transcription regulator [Pseudomonadota bacterium]